MKYVKSGLVYLAANGIGLLLAVLLLQGFTVTFSGFVFAVLVFCVVQAVLRPLIERVSKERLPQIMGGIALVTIFFGLLITELLVGGLTIGGLANWLGATLLIWIGSLVASIFLPRLLGGTAEKKPTT